MVTFSYLYHFRSIDPPEKIKLPELHQFYPLTYCEMVLFTGILKKKAHFWHFFLNLYQQAIYLSRY